MPSASRIAHAGLPFANPMSEAAVEHTLAAMPLPVAPAATIADIGCGNGELLLRALRAHPGARGIGFDLDPDAIAEARAAAAAAAKSESLRAEFEVRDAAAIDSTFDAVINIAASHVIGGYPTALTRLRSLGRGVVYGEGFWRTRPSPAFLDALGGATEDELSDLDGLNAAIVAAGFTCLDARLASEDDWAQYEETLAANAERHGSPESRAYAERIRRRRALPDGTDTLGFALFVLR